MRCAILLSVVNSQKVLLPNTINVLASAKTLTEMRRGFARENLSHRCCTRLLLVALLMVVSGCVGVPTSTSTQGVVSPEALDSLIGLSAEQLVERLGPPDAEVRYQGIRYFFYSGSWKWEEGILLPAPWFVFVPFVIAGTAGGDISRGDMCYAVHIDQSGRVIDADAKKVKSPDCLREYWSKGELATIKQHFFARAQQGDSEAAYLLQAGFGETPPNSAKPIEDLSTAAYLALQHNNPASLAQLAQGFSTEAAIIVYTLSGDIRPLSKLALQGHAQASAAIAAMPAQKSAAVEGDMQQQVTRANTLQDRLVWLCHIADDGNNAGRYSLALLYEYQTQGTSNSRVRAQMWYRLAATAGHVWGNSNADRLSQGADEKEREAVQALLNDWQPGQCEAEMAGNHLTN